MAARVARRAALLVAWAAPVAALIANTLVAWDLLARVDRASCEVGILIRLAVERVEGGQRVGTDVPPGRELAVRGEFNLSTRMISYSLWVTEGLPLVVTVTAHPRVEVVGRGGALARAYFKPFTMTHSEYARYFGSLTGSLRAALEPTIRAQRELLEALEGELTNLRPRAPEGAADWVSSRWLVEALRRATSRAGGELLARVSCRAVVYAAYPFGLEARVVDVPVYEVRVRYNGSEVIGARVRGLGPAVVRLELPVRGLSFASYAASWGAALDALAVAGLAACALLPRTRRALARHLRAAALAAGLLLLLASPAAYGLGDVRVGYLLVLVSDLSAGGQPWPLSPSEVPESGQLRAVVACCQRCEAPCAVVGGASVVAVEDRPRLLGYFKACPFSPLAGCELRELSAPLASLRELYVEAWCRPVGPAGPGEPRERVVLRLARSGARLLEYEPLLEVSWAPSPSPLAGAAVAGSGGLLVGLALARRPLRLGQQGSGAERRAPLDEVAAGAQRRRETPGEPPQ